MRPPYATGMGLGLGRLEAEGKALFLVVDDGEKHELNLVDAIQESMKYIDDDDLSFYDSFLDRYFEYMNMDDISLRELPPRYRRTYMQSAVGLNSVREFREKYNCKLNINFISADRLHQQTYSIKNMGSFARPRTHEERSMEPLQVIQEQVKDRGFTTSVWRYKNCHVIPVLHFDIIGESIK